MLERLTPQQRLILPFVARGLSNKQIATEIAISESTVKAHVKAMLTKLSVHNRTQAAMVWLRAQGPGAVAAAFDYHAGVPDDIRAKGWTVAVHNDYSVRGMAHTFWLFTAGGRAVKGEGITDAEALNEVRKQLGIELRVPAPQLEATA